MFIVTVATLRHNNISLGQKQREVIMAQFLSC